MIRQRRIVRPGIVDVRGGSALDVSASAVQVVVASVLLATEARRSQKVLFLLHRRRLQLSLVYLLLLSLWILVVLVLVLVLMRNPWMRPTAVSDHLLFLFNVGRRAFDSPHDFVVGPLEFPHGGVNGRGALFEKVLEFHGQHPVTFGLFSVSDSISMLFPFPQSNETWLETIKNYRAAQPLHMGCLGRRCTIVGSWKRLLHLQLFQPIPYVQDRQKVSIVPFGRDRNLTFSVVGFYDGMRFLMRFDEED
jgi:hypothetical protein